MPSTPYAKLLLTIDGGAAQSGGLTVPDGAEIGFVYESTVGWSATPPAYLEIYEYPDGWEPVPSTGWVETQVTQRSGAVASVWRYYGTTPPPAIAAPEDPLWGKVMLALVVGGGQKAGAESADMRDLSTSFETLSPTLELTDLAYREGSQFGDWRGFVHGIKENYRRIETGGTVGPTGPTGPAGATGATGPTGPTGATGPTGPAGVASATSPLRLTGTALDWYPTGNVSMNPDGTERSFTGSSGMSGTALTLGAPTTVSVAGSGATTVDGLTVANSVIATAITTVQQAPAIVQKSTAWVSGSLDQQWLRIRTIPRTSNNIDTVFEQTVDGGSSWSTRLTLTSSDADGFVPGVVAGRFINTSGNGFVFAEYDMSGVTIVGGTESLSVRCRSVIDPLVLRADADMLIQTGGENTRIHITEDGAQVHSIKEGEAITWQWGVTAGARVTYWTEDDISTVNATPVNVITYALPSSVAMIATLHVTAADVASGDTNTYVKKYKVKRRAGGAVTLGTAAVVLEDEDDASWNARLNVSGANLLLEFTGDASNQVIGRARLELDFNTYTPV